MSRKDTILIAVIINAGLLAVLFATAIIYDTDKEIDQNEFEVALAEAKPVQLDQNQIKAAASQADPAAMRMSESAASVPLKQEELYFQDPIPSQAFSADDGEVQEEAHSVQQSDYVEVTVKKGDSLDKIARANGTSVSAIKKASGLANEKLSIGQVLKIPLKRDQPAAQAVSRPVESSDAVYHIVKSGDSPWKIAKQYGVNYEDILLLNQLDEEKARNLKIGDRIRVK
jgi:peptidoglycan DL-endopeptidase LytF